MDLGRKCGIVDQVSQNMRRYEKGERGISGRLLAEFAEALDVSTDWLLRGGPGGPVPDPGAPASPAPKPKLRAVPAEPFRAERAAWIDAMLTLLGIEPESDAWQEARERISKAASPGHPTPQLVLQLAPLVAERLRRSGKDVPVLRKR